MNLREEFRSLLEDECGGIARWLLLRMFTGEKSEYWNDITKEAIGGPEYMYSDVLIEGYSAPAVSGISRKREGVVVVDPAQLDITSEVFYLMYDVPIKLNDEIYELNWEHKEKPTVVYERDQENLAEKKVCPKRKYRVQKAEPKRGDEGRIEFVKVYCEREMLR